MSERQPRRIYVENPDGTPVTTEQWDARNAAAAQAASGEPSLMDQIRQGQADRAAEASDRAAYDAELLGSAPEGWVQATDERHGPGTALGILRGDIDPDDLRSTPPTFAPASGDGSRVGIPEVKAAQAAAENQHDPRDWTIPE